MANQNPRLTQLKNKYRRDHSHQRAQHNREPHKVQPMSARLQAHPLQRIHHWRAVAQATEAHGTIPVSTAATPI